MTVREAVEDAMHHVFPEYSGPINDQITAADVPGWDSFTHVQLMFEIENRLGTEIDVADTYDLQSVGELINHLARLKDA